MRILLLFFVHLSQYVVHMDEQIYQKSVLIEDQAGTKFIANISTDVSEKGKLWFRNRTQHTTTQT